jgi:hypothetical protein
LHKQKSSPLPKHTDKKELADTFSRVFADKILRVREGLQNMQPNPENDTFDATITQPLASFHPVTEEWVSKALGATSPKSCDLDPHPYIAPEAMLCSCHPHH